jgi:hypothetical protein
MQASAHGRGNERVRSLLSPHIRCNVCIALGTNVYVRSCMGERGVSWRATPTKRAKRAPAPVASCGTK